MKNKTIQHYLTTRAIKYYQLWVTKKYYLLSTQIKI